MIYPFYRTCPDVLGTSRKEYRSGCTVTTASYSSQNYSSSSSLEHTYSSAGTHILCTGTPILCTGTPLHDYEHFRKVRFFLTTLIKYIPNTLILTFYRCFPISVLPLESTCELPISNVNNNLSVLKKQQIETPA